MKIEFKSHEIVRTIKSNHFGKEVSLLEISLFLNLIVTGSVDRNVYLWDFEYARLVT